MSSPTIIGLKELKIRLQKAQDKLFRDVDRELNDGARAIASEAKQRAPGDVGTLRQAIDSRKVEANKYEVFSNAEYSPYVEFGTLEKVQVPAELAEYAAQFKGNFASGLYSEGGALTAKEAIFAWCQRHSIDKDFWYAVYISVVTYGIEAKPFFFPAFNRISPIIIDRVKKVLAGI